MKRTVINGIIAALFVCSIGTAYACYVVQTNPCGSKDLTGNSYFPITAYSCTDPNGGNWQSAVGTEQGSVATSPATFTCVWSCLGVDSSGLHTMQLGQSEDENSSVPYGGACGYD